MQWDHSRNAGFTTGTPWIPVQPNYTEINAANALADPTSVLHHYRRLISLRHDEPVVAEGDFHMLLPDDESVYAFTRSLDDVTLLVLGNFSGGGVDAAVPDAARWAGTELILGNYPAPDSGAQSIRLRPWETRVYRRGQRSLNLSSD
jgi:oligo-1,6-glucosidase